MQLQTLQPSEMISIIPENVILPPPPEMIEPSTSGFGSRSAKTSFPAHVLLHRLLGTSVMFSALVSLILITTKSCDKAVVYEPESRDLIAAQSMSDMQTIEKFVKSYYFSLQILHIFIFFGSIHIIVLGTFDLVPKQDTDYRFAFHFISVFVVFIVAGIAVYSTYIAFTRPCQAASTCCLVINSPGLLSPSDKPTLTSISLNDIQMLLVMVLDLTSFLAFVLLGIIYFRDVRRLAADCGYLHRVHNEGYIIRQF